MCVCGGGGGRLLHTVTFLVSCFIIRRIKSLICKRVFLIEMLHSLELGRSVNNIIRFSVLIFRMSQRHTYLAVWQCHL